MLNHAKIPIISRVRCSYRVVTSLPYAYIAKIRNILQLSRTANKVQFIALKRKNCRPYARRARADIYRGAKSKGKPYRYNHLSLSHGARCVILPWKSSLSLRWARREIETNNLEPRRGKPVKWARVRSTATLPLLALFSLLGGPVRKNREPRADATMYRLGKPGGCAPFRAACAPTAVRRRRLLRPGIYIYIPLALSERQRELERTHAAARVKWSQERETYIYRWRAAERGRDVCMIQRRGEELF